MDDYPAKRSSPSAQTKKLGISFLRKGMLYLSETTRNVINGFQTVRLCTCWDFTPRKTPFTHNPNTQKFSLCSYSQVELYVNFACTFQRYLLILWPFVFTRKNQWWLLFQPANQPFIWVSARWSRESNSNCTERRPLYSFVGEQSI